MEAGMSFFRGCLVKPLFMIKFKNTLLYFGSFCDRCLNVLFETRFLPVTLYMVSKLLTQNIPFDVNSVCLATR